MLFVTKAMPIGTNNCGQLQDMETSGASEHIRRH